VELAQLQDREVGDGTTSVVIIAAELLRVCCQPAFSLLGCSNCRTHFGCSALALLGRGPAFYSCAFCFDCPRGECLVVDAYFTDDCVLSWLNCQTVHG